MRMQMLQCIISWILLWISWTKSYWKLSNRLFIFFWLRSINSTILRKQSSKGHYKTHRIFKSTISTEALLSQKTSSQKPYVWISLLLSLVSVRSRPIKILLKCLSKQIQDLHNHILLFLTISSQQGINFTIIGRNSLMKFLPSRKKNT